MAACSSSRPRILISPDGKHIAEYEYNAGFLGRDFTSVDVRGKWSIFPSEAYRYSGPSDWSGTQVLWLDDRHLQIRYVEDRQGRLQHCYNEAAGITVQCLAMLVPTLRKTQGLAATRFNPSRTRAHRVRFGRYGG